MASGLVSLFVTELRMRRSSRQSSRPSAFLTRGDQEILKLGSDIPHHDKEPFHVRTNQRVPPRAGAGAHRPRQRAGALRHSARTSDRPTGSLDTRRDGRRDQSFIGRDSHVRHRQQRAVSRRRSESRTLQGVVRSQWVHPRRTSRRQRRPRTHLRGEHRDERRGIDRIGAGHRRVAARRQPQHAHRAQRQRRGVRSPAEGTVVPVDRADRAVGECR